MPMFSEPPGAGRCEASPWRNWSPSEKAGIEADSTVQGAKTLLSEKGGVDLVSGVLRVLVEAKGVLL